MAEKNSTRDKISQEANKSRTHADGDRIWAHNLKKYKKSGGDGEARSNGNNEKKKLVAYFYY